MRGWMGVFLWQVGARQKEFGQGQRMWESLNQSDQGVTRYLDALQKHEREIIRRSRLTVAVAVRRNAQAETFTLGKPSRPLG